VVLAAGGFVYNREMIEQHAPGYRKGMPLGTPADNGSGIQLGQSVGGGIDRMGRVSAWRFINPPVAFAHGFIVNKQGQRYINEMRYGAAIGEAMVDQNEGTALLVIDQHLKDLAREQSRPGEAQWFQRAPALLNLWFNSKKGNTIEELAAAIKVPADALRKTLDGLQPEGRQQAVRRVRQDARHHARHAPRALLRHRLLGLQQALPLPDAHAGRPHGGGAERPREA
jgi:3-oxo-5alpha-steroid 4-dehydrogenase